MNSGVDRQIEYAPGECFNGAYHGFFGVEMRDGSDRVLEFFRNGQEPRIAFYAPGFAAFELGPSDCSSFAGELHRGDEVWGNVRLDCEAPSGWSVWGELSFEGCELPVEEDCDDDDDWDDDDDDDWDWDDDDDDSFF
ncbi:MAG: hypothetical protein AAF799_05870 [Myxococcota bacterium]